MIGSRMIARLFGKLCLVAQVGVGLVLLSSGLLLLFLLLTDGHPVPRQFSSYRQLGFELGYPVSLVLDCGAAEPDSTPAIIFSNSVRFFAKGISHPECKVHTQYHSVLLNP